MAGHCAAMADALHFHAPAIHDDADFTAIVPAIVADTHPDADKRFVEYFAATIRNPNTRAA